MSESVPLVELGAWGDGDSFDTEDFRERQDDSMFGTKTIGFWGSVVFCVNSITGAGMLAIPLMFQQGISSPPPLLLLISN